MSETVQETLMGLLATRQRWVDANRENGFEQGVHRLLSDLYPDEAHFIYELLQNAEDAGATHVQFLLDQNQIAVLHDGRSFTVEDVERITSIGDSAKESDVNAIGKFGVGFKAVFSYTNTPRIQSGSFSIEIRDLVCPHSIPRFKADSSWTVFEFPFNNPKRSIAECVQEINDGLRSLSDTVLLFLRNIRRISWQVPSLPKVEIVRHEYTINVIEIQRIGSQASSGSFWLRFIEPAPDGYKGSISAAFELEKNTETALSFDVPRAIGTQFKLVPTEGRLFIYFPVEKEVTRLRFHLHGSYASTVARDSIPTHDPKNRELLKATARMLAQNIEKIKTFGLLNSEFLELLPNNDDGLGEFFQPILTEALGAFRTEELIPTIDDSYSSASGLFRGSANIREHLSAKDIAFLTDRPIANWVIGVMQNQRADKFLDALGIPEWSWADLHSAMQREFGGIVTIAASNWLAGKSDEWLREFYGILLQMLQKEKLISQSYRWNNPQQHELIQKWPIVRLQDGRHVSGASSVLFPGEGIENLDCEIVKQTICEDVNEEQIENARRFLKAVGVRDVEESDKVNLLLKKHYLTSMQTVSQETHVTHLRRFINWWDSNRRDASQFSGYYIFRIRNNGLSKPEDVYIDGALEETGLDALFKATELPYPNRFLLDEDYKTADLANILDFAESCGVMRRLKIKKTDTTGNPEYRYLHDGGGNLSYNEVDEDYDIDHLEEILAANDGRISLLLWNTIRKEDRKFQNARYRKSANQEYRYAPSKLVSKLRDRSWIPMKLGGWKKASEILRDDLADDFVFDDQNGWLTAIGYKPDFEKEALSREEQRAFSKLGISPDQYAQLKSVPDADRQRIASEVFNKLMSAANANNNPSSLPGQQLPEVFNRQEVGRQMPAIEDAHKISSYPENDGANASASGAAPPPHPGSRSNLSPHPEEGLKAQEWLRSTMSERLDGDVWKVSSNEQVFEGDPGRIDIVVMQVASARRFYIEAKRIEGKKIYWSANQIQTAKNHPQCYFIALLEPIVGSLEHHIYWLWDPLKTLKNLRRQVQWNWTNRVAGSFDLDWQPLDNAPTEEAANFRAVIETPEEFIRSLPEGVERIQTQLDAQASP